uniref:glutathione-specific gamma-glutamylcyclotransferase n=1 Tax=Graphocephala atropunctata TaxID=36148 RepID=A0A1B6LMI0_9HEMI
MSEMCNSDTLWIFGYGSLLWKTEFPFAEKQVGFIKGYLRRFYQSSKDHRGIPDKPGRVVTLLPSPNSEDQVWGIAYKIEDKDKDLVVRQLDFREKNGYTKVNITFYPVDLVAKTEGKPFKLVIYVGEKTNEHYAGEADVETIAQQIVAACGPSGTNREYLYRLADAMRAIAPGQDDIHLFSLEAAVKRLESKSSLISR